MRSPREDVDEDDDPRPRRRSKSIARPPKGNGWWIGALVAVAVVGVLFVVCAGVGVGIWWSVRQAPVPFPEEAESYAQARQHFQTRLVRKGPAPQPWQPVACPAEVDEVEYLSGNLRLKAWVNRPRDKGAAKPAVLFLHGGFAFDREDWDQAQPFRDAGFVVMTPMLRGENGLPGFYSMFYDEVEDVRAAGDTLAKIPGVDAKRIYVVGHSVGGTLALLSAMSTDRFRAAASFSGSPDQEAWSRGQPEVIPFNPADKREMQMRSPLAFPRSFQCPVRLYFGSQEPFFTQSSQKTALRAKAANLDVEAIVVPGDHVTAVAPAMAQCIQFFHQK